MLRKLTLLSLLITSTPTFAGWYAGVGFGPEFANFNQTATFRQASFVNVHDSRDFSGTGVFGSLFGGYGYQYQAFYLAGEVNGNLSSVASRASNNEANNLNFATVHYRIQNSYGVSVLPGLFIGNYKTLFYGRIGYANGSFKINSSDSTIVNTIQRENGFRYGAGLNQPITKNLSMRMEYSHIDYQSQSFTFRDGITVKSTTVWPETGQVEFGLVYHFA